MYRFHMRAYKYIFSSLGKTNTSVLTIQLREAQTLRPVTIKQIHDATQAYPEANFKISGTDITQICIVGQVRNISKLATFVTYRLDDGTGELDVKHFLDNDEKNDLDEFDGADAMDLGMDGSSGTAPRPKRQQVVVNSYAKAWGVMKSFNDRRSVNIHLIRPLTDMNEYFFHFVEATAVHLFFEKGPPPTKGAQGSIQAAGGAEAGGKSLPPGASALAQRVFQTLNNTPQTNEGLHVNNLASHSGMPINEVYKATEELSSLGVIYTTVDDDTWAIL